MIRRKREKEETRGEGGRERQKKGKQRLTSSWPQNRKNGPLILLKTPLEAVIQAAFSGTGLLKRRREKREEREGERREKERERYTRNH